MKEINSAIERIFKLSERFSKKTIVMNGFNKDTQYAMSFLANRGIPICAFLLTDDKNNDIDNKLLVGQEYLTKPLVTIDELREMHLDNIVLLNVFPSEYNESEDYGFERDVLFKPYIDNLYIYGAGECGKKFYDFCGRCGIKILAFIDGFSKETNYSETPIIGLDSLDSMVKDSTIVIAINSKQKNDEVNDMLKGKGFTNIFYYRYNDFFDIFVCTDDGMDGEMDCPKRVCLPKDLRYIYKYAVSKENKFYVYNGNPDFLKRILHVFHTIGIHKVYGLSKDIQSMDFEDTYIYDFYELIYMDNESMGIFLLGEDVPEVKKILCQCGLSNIPLINICCAPMLFSRVTVPDVNLGYADKRGLYVARNCNTNDEPFKLGILGGSTSEYDLYYEKSWGYYLLHIAKSHNIKLEIYDGAIAGYKSSQECMRLIRDLLPHNLDAVVCYSGINDANEINYYKNHASINNYQIEMFRKICKDEDGFSIGEIHDNPILEWFTNQRIMHAVCMEFGIKHMTFLQPCIHYKYDGCNEKIELTDIYMNRKKSTRDEWDIRTDRIKRMSKMIDGQYEWMVDLTGIFENIGELVYLDDLHLMGKGNTIVAEAIFEQLLKAGILG